MPQNQKYCALATVERLSLVNCPIKSFAVNFSHVLTCSVSEPIQRP